MFDSGRESATIKVNNRMDMKYFFCMMIIILLAACSDTEDVESQSVLMGLEVRDERIVDLVDRHVKPTIIAEGFVWSEGPLWLEDRDALIFADVPSNSIFEWRAGDSLRVYMKQSGYPVDDKRRKNSGSNGMVLDADGKLILCQHGLRQVVRMTNSILDPSPIFETIADRYEGKRFNSPNDICIASDGTLFFTDPPYGLEDPTGPELLYSGVFMVTPEKEVTLLIDSLTKPNGIALSPDEDRLYVAVSDPEGAVYHVYDLDENFRITEHELLFDATHLLDKGLKGLPDGIKVHSSGTIFATGPGGVLVFSPKGEWLGSIRTGDRASANLAFNTDESMLFITATDWLLKVPLKTNDE